MAASNSKGSRSKSGGNTDIEQGNQPQGMKPVLNEEGNQQADQSAAADNEAQDHPRAEPVREITTPSGNVREDR